MNGELTKTERCFEYWNRLPVYKRTKYFTELKEASLTQTFNELEDGERALVTEHISRVLKLND